MRCYLDADLSPRVAEIARAQGLDAVSAYELGQHERADGEILRLAAGDGRCLVTRNRDDFILLTVQFFENEWPHAGVLIASRSLPNRDFAGLARALVTYAGRYPGAMEPYTINFLSAG